MILKIEVILKALEKNDKEITLGNILQYISDNSAVSIYKNLIPKDIIISNSYRGLIREFTVKYPDGNEIDLIEFLKLKETDYIHYLNYIEVPEKEETAGKSTEIKGFIGREKELELLDIFLNRRIKKNVLVVGDPGVGKTSLINFYASVSNKNIKEVRCSSVLSGTKYRGEFEEKLTAEIEQAILQNDILFIDEAHILVEAGATEGGISAANILKPYLTDENFTMIGATTLDEYQLFLKDRAFERRFNFLFLDEISEAELFTIFINLMSSKHLRNRAMFEKIVSLLNQYLPDRNYPDKLIDFVDFYNAASMNNYDDFKQIVDLFVFSIPLKTG